MANDGSGKKQLIAASFDQGALVYDEYPFFAIFGRSLVEAARLEKGDRVLDVATGTGAALLPAAAQLGEGGYVHGIDLSASMAEVAQGLIERNGIRNASARQMDAEHLDFPDAYFDCVLCAFALWFIPDLQGAMGEMQRVLKPGGRLVASTWSEVTDPIAQRTNALQKSYAVPMPALGSHNLSTAGALASVLKDAGWVDVEVREVTASYGYRDGEEWWQSRPNLFQTSRAMLAPDALARFKQDTLAILRESQRDDGIKEERKALFGIGRKA